MATAGIVYTKDPNSNQSLLDATTNNLSTLTNPVQGFLGLFTGQTQAVWAAVGSRVGITLIGIGLCIVGIVFVVSGTKSAQQLGSAALSAVTKV